MAEIKDPNAVRFANTRIRPMADRLAQLYYLAVLFSDEFKALGLDTIFLKNPDSVSDGSATDGRPPITGTDVNNIITLAIAFKDLMEANSKEPLNQVLRVGVNTTP